MSDLCPSCGQPGTMLDRQYRGQSGASALWRKRKCPLHGTWETLELNFAEITAVIRSARKSARTVLRIERELSVFLRGLQSQAPPKRAEKASPPSCGLAKRTVASETVAKENSHA